MRQSRLVSSVCALACLFLALPAWSLCQPHGAGAASRPSIGLVLSGGGARGGAHVGVLEALTELRVPIDCIAGTSVGAVVGGFYAAGLSAEQINTLLDGLNWDDLVHDKTPRALRSFRRKRQDDLFMVNMRPGIRSGQIALPIGLVQGQVVDTVLERYTMSAATIHDFDKLPIPFRAVATGIATGQAVILDHGSLALAIRASMAIPAALTPVRIDNQLLVDGGLSMNLPVEVAQRMGAQVIIAVDITAPLIKKKGIKNIVDVTSQMTNLLTTRTVEKERSLLDKNDILIEPTFPDNIGSMEFSRMQDAVKRGYLAVMAHRQQLEKYALSPSAYEAYRARVGRRVTGHLPPIDFIRLDNHSKIRDSVLLTRFGNLADGKPLAFPTVRKAIDRVYGLQLFQNVRYDLTTEGDQTGMVVSVVPRSWGPNYLQLGLHYSSTQHSDALFGLAASYLRTAMNPLGGELRATIEIGDEPALTLDGYQPLGPKGLFFVEPKLSFTSTRYNVFDGNDLLSEAQVRESMLEFSGGREFMTWGEARLGLRRTVGDTEHIVGLTSGLPADRFDRGELFLRVAADTLDAIAFPTRGVAASVELRASLPNALGADQRYDQLLADSTYAKTWGRRTLVVRARYDGTVHGTVPLAREPMLGGFLDLSGLNPGQLRAPHVARVGLNYYRRIGDLIFLPAFAGVSLEVGKAWGHGVDFSGSETHVGGSVWVGVSSPVGPVYLGYGRAEGGNDAFYVYLGRAF